MHDMPHSPVGAVVIDLVKSRSHDDRRALQQTVMTALALVNDSLPALIPLAPTYADEFQGLYADPRAAVLATYLVRLHLPEGTDCRFGIGVGESTVVERVEGTTILDGSAWWAARSAIETTKRREDAEQPWLRTWYEVGDGYHQVAGVPDEAITNAYLLCRDELIAALSTTARQALLRRQLGQTQEQIAAALGVTQSTVSRSLTRSGTAALTSSISLLEGALS